MKPMKRLLISCLGILVGLLLIYVYLPLESKRIQDIQYLPGIEETRGKTSAKVKIETEFGRIPLYFIPNQGQVKKKVKFYAKTSCYTLWMTENGLVFDSAHTLASGHPFQERIIETPLSPHSPHSTYSTKFLLRDVSRLIFLNANPKPEIVPVEMTQHKVNYFIGKDPSKWQKGIPTAKAILYKNIYNNIDLKVYGNEKQIEYDWIVKPGGDPADIRFEYKNVKSVGIDNEWNLVIETQFGKLIHKKPVSYQLINGEKVNINSHFESISKNIYGFRIKAYDRNYELIIDPVVSLDYSTFLGGSGDDMGQGIAVDDSGCIYVSGRTDSLDFPIEAPCQNVMAGYLDVIVSKFNAAGSALLYSTYLGGSNWEEGYSCALTPDGLLYVAGTTHSDNFPSTGNTWAGANDAFVCLLDKDGNLKFSRYLGGNGHDYGFAVAVDPWGSAYVIGQTRSSDFPTLNAYKNTLDGISDVFISKVHYNDGLIYSTYLGGGHSDRGLAVAVDNSGSCYVTGDTYSTDFPVKNAYQDTFAGGNIDCFISKLNPDGSGLIYSTYLGGSGNEAGWGITVHGSGAAYVTGNTFSSDFPTKNAYQDSISGPRDAFVTKMTADGFCLVFSTYLGGSANDVARGIEIDNLDYIYVSGNTTSNDFPTKHTSSGANGGIFLTKFLTDGTGLIYSTYFGGTCSDYNEDMAVDESGNAYVTGYTYSANFPVKNAYQNSYAGGLYDGFVSKISFPYTLCHLAVKSTPITGVPVSVIPDDFFEKGDGETDFTRTYLSQTIVTLTAPETFKNKVFKQWIIDGVDNSDRTIRITIEDNHTVKAVYKSPLPTRNLTVKSKPGNGVPISVSPHDINGDGDGNTNFKRTYDSGTIVRLTAPDVVKNKIFHKWTIDGIDNSNRTIQLTMDNNHTVTALYQLPSPTWTLTVKSKPGNGVPITVSPHDINGDDDGKTKFTRMFNPNEVVTITAPKVINSKIFYKWTIGEVDNFDRIIQVKMDDNHTVTVEYRTPAVITLNRTSLYFGASTFGPTTGEQTFFVGSSGGSTLNWTLSTSASWLHCSPTSGTGSGEVTVSVDAFGLSKGTYNGAITVSDPNASNSPLIVSVILVVYDGIVTGVPFGYFDTPWTGTTVYGSIPVTGWALDDIEVERVKIYREEGKDLVYIGDAVFVEGARPDVEVAYPTYPKSYRAGWGYMMLTNFLPGGGNGTFIIHAIAEDKEGNKVTLGKKTIICDNAHAFKPFGALDAPPQGGIASGPSFVNFGWALTPQPNIIPIDGSTINVWIDGVNVGNPVYNNYRADIATLFPGYVNSNGAVGYFYIDTTQYENGVHTIQWTALDSAGNVDGIGSRYFIIQNTGESGAQETSTVQCSTFNVDITQIPMDYCRPVRIKKDFKENIKYKTIYPNQKGITTIRIKESQLIEIHLAGPGRRDGKGFQLVEDRLQPLPVGSTFDTERGVFYWLPGPGFVGMYRLVFVEEKANGEMRKKFINVEIIPKFMNSRKKHKVL
jgi:hypothetical protein